MTKIKSRESQNVEYKSSWHDEYLKWICGFANAQGAVMYFGVDNASRPRNLNIANAFFKAGFIDTWGRGYKKNREGFEPAGIPMPKVENFCGGVQVTIERTQFMKMLNVRDVGKDGGKDGGNVTSNVTSDVTSDVGSDVGSMSVVQLTERQQKICELIKKDSFISAQQMSVVLSVVKRTIERDLADMQKKGVLIREGNTSAGHWIVLLKKPEG